MKDNGRELAENIYYSPTKWEQECRFWPVRGGRSITKPGYLAGPKRIECYSLHFVREGRVQLEFNGEMQLLEAGDLFCLFPWEAYVYRRVDSDRALELSWLAIDGPGAGEAMASIDISRMSPFIRKRGGQAVYQFVSRLLSLMGKGEEGGATTQKTAWQLQGGLYELFSMLMDSPAEQGGQGQWLQQSLDYIELHACEGIMVHQVANEVGINRTYFTAEFTKLCGCSPGEYINKLRLHKAKELLLDTSASITEIAYSTGYSSLYTFSRAFKNMFSMSPANYRDHVFKREYINVTEHEAGLFVQKNT